MCPLNTLRLAEYTGLGQFQHELADGGFAGLKIAEHRRESDLG